MMRDRGQEISQVRLDVLEHICAKCSDYIQVFLNKL